MYKKNSVITTAPSGNLKVILGAELIDSLENIDKHNIWTIC